MTLLSYPAVHNKSRNVLYPNPRHESVVVKNLSITDSAVSAIAGPECIWFFDRTDLPGYFNSESLIKSLQKALVAYPFFAGKLEQIPFKLDGHWTERQGRLRVVFGRNDDPGIQVSIASCEQKLSAVIPNSRQRGSIWDSSGVPFELFSGSEIHMALHDGVKLGDLSLMRVKITTFRCGGVSIAAKIVHPLADAQTLCCFIKHWSDIHQRPSHDLATSQDKTTLIQDLSPILAPELFMSTAAGNLNAQVPDGDSTITASGLPMHRYDWWASSTGCPEPFLWRTKIAPEVLASGIGLPPLGIPIPWEDLDITQPISHYNILFSPKEISRMHEAASMAIGNEFRLSHLDALLSHVWTLIIRARNLPLEDNIFFNMVVSFRSRVQPPLSKYYVGTPAILAFAKATTEEAVSDGSLPKLATTIRSTIAALNSSTIPHFLHDAAHQIEPKRYWQTFIGKHHITASSWLNHGLYDINFGSSVGPRYIEPVMPPYLLCITESDVSHSTIPVQLNGDHEKGKYKPWYEKGAVVSLHFETSVMDRLLQDPTLRAFDY